MLGPIALLFAVVSLAVNFVVPGPQGPAGIDGTNGTNGTDGRDGTNGTNGTPGPRSMGMTISRSTDQTNWSVEVIVVPSGGVATSATLIILNAGGGTALPAEALSSITYAGDGAVFASDGDTAVEVTERILINRTTYPAGYQIRIADTGGILFSGTLA